MPPSTEPAAGPRPPTRPPYAPEPDAITALAALAARRTQVTRTQVTRTQVTRTLDARRAES